VSKLIEHTTAIQRKISTIQEEQHFIEAIPGFQRKIKVRTDPNTCINLSRVGQESVILQKIYHINVKDQI
jgi:hypothetical protein